jgi:hypothetical protein
MLRSRKLLHTFTFLNSKYGASSGGLLPSTSAGFASRSAAPAPQRPGGHRKVIHKTSTLAHPPTPLSSPLDISSRSPPAAATASTMPVAAALLQSAKVIFVTNAVGFGVTAVTQSHKITDLTGTAAFAASAIATLVTTAGRPLSLMSPSVLLTGAVATWAVRLGSYLFYRVLQVGKVCACSQEAGHPFRTLMATFR